uniref:Uncharacterized protein n=1 Tax=Meloidogyne hapla TaxID=6305 RepID=A0A1I8BG49_MELHA
MEQQKQQIHSNKKFSKAIPIELLINIFKAIKTCPDEIEVQKNMNKIIKNEMFEKWNGYAKNVLTTTGIIYLVIREGFQKKKESDMAAKKLQLQKEADEKLRNAEYFERVYQWAKSSMTPVEDAVNAVGLLRQQQILDVLIKLSLDRGDLPFFVDLCHADGIVDHKIRHAMSDQHVFQQVPFE